MFCQKYYCNDELYTVYLAKILMTYHSVLNINNVFPVIISHGFPLKNLLFCLRLQLGSKSIFTAKICLSFQLNTFFWSSLLNKRFFHQNLTRSLIGNLFFFDFCPKFTVLEKVVLSPKYSLGLRSIPLLFKIHFGPV